MVRYKTRERRILRELKQYQRLERANIENLKNDLNIPTIRQYIKNKVDVGKSEKQILAGLKQSLRQGHDTYVAKGFMSKLGNLIDKLESKPYFKRVGKVAKGTGKVAAWTAKKSYGAGKLDIDPFLFTVRHPVYFLKKLFGKIIGREEPTYNQNMKAIADLEKVAKNLSKDFKDATEDLKEIEESKKALNIMRNVKWISDYKLRNEKRKLEKGSKKKIKELTDIISEEATSIAAVVLMFAAIYLMGFSYTGYSVFNGIGNTIVELKFFAGLLLFIGALVILGRE